MIYNCFISNNPDLPSIGNPSSVFLGEYTREEMSQLAIKMGTPISCFVKVLEEEAHVTFFAQNGQEDGFCGHGLISVIKHLKEKGFGHINTLISASGVKLTAKVLENGISSLEIPVSGFQINPHEKTECVKFFELPAESILEVFKTSPLGDIVFEVSSPESLKNITLDPAKVAEFSEINNIRIMVFFCKGSSFEGIDVEIRVFCSKLYELEDVVCGSANISVSNVLFNKYGISKYKVVQPFQYLQTGKIGGYQELEYDNQKKILTLNGFASPFKERFIFQPLDIEFDKNLNPIKKTEDYYFLRSILMDIEVMKTSTFLAGGIPENDYDLHNLMNSLLEKDEAFKKNYGLQKIWHLGLQKYVGVMGLMRIDEKLKEAGALLKSEFIGSGIGFWVYKYLSEKLEKVGGAFTSSVWIENTASVKLIKKNGMSLISKTSKSYKNRTMEIEVYIKYAFNSAPSNIINIQDYLSTNKISEIKKAS